MVEVRSIFSQDYSNPVEIEKLTKIYYPAKTVLEDINLTIVEGESIGILGNNGAGKTTLLRLLATLLYPSAGSILIYGFDTRFESTEIKKLIGYLPERLLFLSYKLTGYSTSNILNYQPLCSFTPFHRLPMLKDLLKKTEVNNSPILLPGIWPSTR